MYESIFKQIVPNSDSSVSPDNPVMLFSRLYLKLQLHGDFHPWKADRFSKLELTTPRFHTADGNTASDDAVRAALGHSPRDYLSMYDALRIARGSKRVGVNKDRLVTMLTEALEDYEMRGIKTGYEAERAFNAGATPVDTRTYRAKTQAAWREKKQANGWKYVTFFLPELMIPEVRDFVKALRRRDETHDRLKGQRPKSQRQLDHEHAAQSAHLKPDREHAAQAESRATQALDIDSFLEEDDFL